MLEFTSNCGQWWFGVWLLLLMCVIKTSNSSMVQVFKPGPGDFDVSMIPMYPFSSIWGLKKFSSLFQLNCSFHFVLFWRNNDLVCSIQRSEAWGLCKMGYLSSTGKWVSQLLLQGLQQWRRCKCILSWVHWSSCGSCWIPNDANGD
jgi:hypothetical protein